MDSEINRHAPTEICHSRVSLNRIFCIVSRYSRKPYPKDKIATFHFGENACERIGFCPNHGVKTTLSPPLPACRVHRK